MTNTEDTLFRPEAVAARRFSLEGDLIVATSRWSNIAGYVLLGLVIAGLATLATADVPRSQLVSGWLNTNRGIIQIQPPRAGIVEAILVRDGDTVVAGQVLAKITTEQMQADIGTTAEAALITSLQQQEHVLQNEQTLAEQQVTSDEHKLKNSIAAMQHQYEAISEQIAKQKAVAGYSEKAAAIYEKLNHEKAMSDLQVWREQSNVAASMRDLASLKEKLNGLAAQIAAERGELARLPLESASRVADLEREHSSLEQKRLEISGQRSYALTAPAAGTVTSVIARQGYFVDGRRPILLIIPAHASLQAELYVPSSAIAFIKEGEEVRLMYSALPFQKYGSARGHIVRISRSALLPENVAAPVEVKEPVYLVYAQPDQQSVELFGKETQLQPGMTLNANIVLERRHVIDWLFEPVYAMRGRS